MVTLSVHIVLTDSGDYKGQPMNVNGADENEEEVVANGTDFEYLLDSAATTTTTSPNASQESQILVEELDANGYSQIRKANLMELGVAGHHHHHQQHHHNHQRED